VHGPLVPNSTWEPESPSSAASHLTSATGHSSESTLM